MPAVRGVLPRKSVEPIALQAGVAPRTLQESLAISRREEGAIRDRVRKIVALDHAHPEAIGVSDATSLPKKGHKTSGARVSVNARYGAA